MNTYCRFCHEIAWYRYVYIQDTRCILIVVKGADPEIMYEYSKEDLLSLIKENKFNVFALPVYQKALSYFPKEKNHDEEE